MLTLMCLCGLARTVTGEITFQVVMVIGNHGNCGCYGNQYVNLVYKRFNHLYRSTKDVFSEYVMYFYGSMYYEVM